MTEGYIKLFRSIKTWEWYSDIPCRLLFFHCLLSANYEEGIFRGKVINPGQFVTSYQNLARETLLTVRQIRYALNKLKLSGELSHVWQGSYSVITINNWNRFQQNGSEIVSKLSANCQRIVTKLSPIEEIKKERNKECSSSSVISVNNSNTIVSNSDTSNTSINTTTTTSNQEKLKLYGKYNNVALTPEQYNRLEAMTLSGKLLDELIEDLSEKIEMGEEKPYIADCPNAHYIRVQRYYKFRKTHPERFKAGRYSTDYSLNAGLEETFRKMKAGEI